MSRPPPRKSIYQHSRNAHLSVRKRYHTEHRQIPIPFLVVTLEVQVAWLLLSGYKNRTVLSRKNNQTQKNTTNPEDTSIQSSPVPLWRSLFNQCQRSYKTHNLRASGELLTVSHSCHRNRIQGSADICKLLTKSQNRKEQGGSQRIKNNVGSMR